MINFATALRSAVSTYKMMAKHSNTYAVPIEMESAAQIQRVAVQMVSAIHYKLFRILMRR